MDLFSAAERLAAIDRSAVQLDLDRCLHSLDQFAACQACRDICPVQALGAPPEDAAQHASSLPLFDEKACVRCLACLPACPTGAFHADDALRSLLNCAARLPEGAVELLCTANPAQDGAHPGTGVAIRVTGCLAGLGSGALAALAAAGFPLIRLRVDACEGCALETLQAQIEAQAAAAQNALQAFSPAQWVETCGAPPTGQVAETPTWEAANPPLSRRDLFRLGGRSGQMALGRALTAGAERSQAGQPPRERQRLLAAFAHLDPSGDPHASFAGLGFAQVTVSEACTACGVCARACPTGALHFTPDEETGAFELTFSIQACTGCQVCAHICAPGAVHIEPVQEFLQVYREQAGSEQAGSEQSGSRQAGSSPVVLRSGALIRCQRCNVLTAAAGDSLCPVCAFRKHNPFGSALLPTMQANRMRGKPRSSA